MIWATAANTSDRWDAHVLLLALDRQGRTSECFRANFPGCAVLIEPGCPVIFDERRQRWQISNPDPHQSRISLLLQGHAQATPIQAQHIHIPIAPFEHPGPLTFDLLVDAPEIVPSVRYFFGLSTQLTRLSYPIFQLAPGVPVALHAQLHPLEPLNQAHTHFALADATPRATHFRTTLGYPLTLAPIANKSRYAIQYDPVDDQAYYVPAGQWQLGVQRNGAAEAVQARDDLMCGLSGVEYLGLATDSSMYFIPGGPAYAPSFGQADGQNDTQRLTNTLANCPYPVTTSWIYVGREVGDTHYYAQPDKSVYYHYNQKRPIRTFSTTWRSPERPCQASRTWPDFRWCPTRACKRIAAS